MQSSATTGRKRTDGFVYLITHPDKEGLVKIGRSVRPQTRLDQANVWCERKRWTMNAAMAFPDAAQAEHAMHVAFADRRLEGEWFQVRLDVAERALMALHMGGS